MELQKILFPQIGRCTEETLYFHFGEVFNSDPTREWVVEKASNYEKKVVDNRKKITLDLHKECISFEKGGRVFFDTYFNGFSMDKWKKYTKLNNLSINLKLQGDFKITLMSVQKIHEEVFVHIIDEKIAMGAKADSVVTYSYDDMTQAGMYTFSIEALSDNCSYYGGSYDTDIKPEEVANVKIGICICTFKREDYIRKNMGILNAAILKNLASPMHGHLAVFISDNGKTLLNEGLESDDIHIFANKNLGGAGGFTRDLVEVYKGNDKYGITHVLLMDDDVIIEPEALVKTFNLLAIIKDEHKEAFIGGAMLRRDKMYFQVESGAQWNAGALKSLKQNYDLREISYVLDNEIEEYREFNAWWYCCFPVSVIREDNLPLPIFIRGDDLEYGLRNIKELILMNGICLWHEPFEYKYSSFLNYYILRNQLIDNSFHFPWYGVKQAKKDIKRLCMSHIMCYRYKDLDLVIRGVEDFLKGPEWLMEQDGEALHKEIMGSGYKFAELKDLPIPFNYDSYENSRELVDTNLAGFKRRLTLNGLFLRANKGDACVPVAATRSVMFYRKKNILHYDVVSGKGFVTTRIDKESWRCIRKTMKLLNKLGRKLPKAQKAYREKGLELRTLAFWEKYLGL